MRRLAVIAGAVVLAALLAAHVVYWYVPRERAVVPRLRAGGGAAPAETGGAAGEGAGEAAGEPLRLLAAGAYDVCVWVPYPHQNLGALAAAIGDLQDVVGAAARLSSGEGSEGSAPRPREPEEAPTFGPFEVPPASEMVACSDLAGGRLRVVARIYPALAVVAKLAGRVAGNPWLAGGAAGSTRIAWQGRLWTVVAGPEAPRLPAAPPANAAAAPAVVASTVVAPAAIAPELPESLAVVHWTGARPEIPAGYYALSRSGSDLSLALVAAGGGGGAGSAAAPPGVPGVAGPLPSLLVAVGPDWRGVEPFAAVPGSGAPPRGDSADSGRASPTLSRGGVAAAGGLGGGAVAARPPAALALFETGGSRLSTLGDLPGLAVFNAAAPGAAPGPVRWRLPTEGIFRLLVGRLPRADLAGWRILALDPGSLRQAEALAPRLAAVVPPIPAGANVPDGASVPVGTGLPVSAGAGTPGALPRGAAARARAGAPGVFPPGPSGAAGVGNGVAGNGSASPPGPGAAGAGNGGAGAGPASAGAAAAVPTTAAPSSPAGRGALSLGVWLEPRSTLRIVTRIRRFVEKFPLASRRQVDLWRDWETVLDPLANCDHAVLAATASPPSMRLLLRGCAAAYPR